MLVDIPGVTTKVCLISLIVLCSLLLKVRFVGQNSILPSPQLCSFLGPSTPGSFWRFLVSFWLLLSSGYHVPVSCLAMASLSDGCSPTVVYGVLSVWYFVPSIGFWLSPGSTENSYLDPSFCPGGLLGFFHWFCWFFLLIPCVISPVSCSVPWLVCVWLSLWVFPGLGGWPRASSLTEFSLRDSSVFSSLCFLRLFSCLLWGGLSPRSPRSF